MRSRTELQDLLETTIGNGNVYYQPPSSKKMQYPAIRYQLDRLKKTTADNKCYRLVPTYQLTLIYKEADSELPVKVAKLDKCMHVQHFMSDNLYHDVYSIEF